MEKLQKDPLQLFPCPACNAQLQFNPAHQQLECGYCGYHVAIDKSTDHIRENSLRVQLSTTDNADAVVEQQVYKCTRCGAETVFTSETATFVCGFCHFEVVNPVAYKTRIVQPSGIVPFNIDKQQGIEIFKKWIGKGWFVPGDLNQFARHDDLNGIYLPFWTYDAQTNSEWSGYGGRYYYETVEEEDADGNKTTREVQRTEWIYRSGAWAQFFDDILVGGSKELPQNEYETIFPYDLEKLVNFDSGYLSGFQADVYDIAVNDGYARAEKIMQNAIYEACANECRIDTYRDLQIDTSYSNQTYKHILLPLWLCSYLYNNKRYYFLINGQTGKINGRKPLSAVKIAIAVILVLAVILALYFIAQSNQSA